MDEFDYHVPGCTLGDKMRNVSMCTDRKKCQKCGWNEDEKARRKKLLETQGLSVLPTGLRGLKV